jgi:hypothetical protein
VPIPQDSLVSGYVISVDQESENYGGGTVNCTFADSSFENLNSTDDLAGDWPSYNGCSANGYNSDNDTYGGLNNQVNGVNSGTHQACHGGQGSINAPLDTYVNGTYPSVTDLHDWLEESNPSESPAVLGSNGVSGSSYVAPGVTPLDPSTATASYNHTPPTVAEATTR